MEPLEEEAPEASLNFTAEVPSHSQCRQARKVSFKVWRAKEAETNMDESMDARMVIDLTNDDSAETESESDEVMSDSERCCNWHVACAWSDGIAHSMIRSSVVRT